MASDSLLLNGFDAAVGSAMGALPPSAVKTPQGPIRLGILWLLATLVCFAFPIWIFDSFSIPPKPVVYLSIWGAIFSGWAVYSANRTSISLRLFVCDIESLLSEGQKEYVLDALKERFDRKELFKKAVMISVLPLIASIFALKDAGIATMQLALVLMEFFLFYVIAAQTTFVGRFYGVFADAIEKYPESLFKLAPSESPVIEAVHNIGKKVVQFLFGIMAAVLTLSLLFQKFPEFVIVIIGVASIFSFVFGSVVYLATESKLRSASRRAAERTQARFDREARALLSLTTPLQNETLRRLSLLSALQSDVSANKRPHGITTAILSIVIPLAGPAVTFIGYLLTRAA